MLAQHALHHIALTQLIPHARNPRFVPRGDIVTQICMQLKTSGVFDPAHAIIVRPLSDGTYEIVSGHHRRLAAEQAGMTEVPCWIREMTDDEAYMALVLMNVQGELHALEEGVHALKSGLSESEYARRAGIPRTTLTSKIGAAEVALAVDSYESTTLKDSWRALSVIHSAPIWLWPALVTQLLAEQWTVEGTRIHVKPLQKIDAPPSWADSATIAIAVVDGSLASHDVARFAAIAATSADYIRQQNEDTERFQALLPTRLMALRPTKLSEVQAICHEVQEEQQALIKERQQTDFLRLKRQEEIAARIARLRRSISLDEWQTLAADEQDALLSLSPQDVDIGTFNAQENTAIEWAQFSWNPVTGCLHNCPYCYARDIAESTRMAKVYPSGFAPMLRPAMLLAPRMMKVPPEAQQDTRYRNVFTCSMADLFGRWVPARWIEAVFREMRAAPQWNFLCLTKFPKRLRELEIPPNAWMGTTVDLQARVKAAEDAFAHITTGVRWLSVEPMLEPLRFAHLDRFDWLVIGGASRSTQTPSWHPPFAWIYELVQQADAAGCRVYFKTNLLGKRRLQLPFDATLPDDMAPAPDVFHYLKEATPD